MNIQGPITLIHGWGSGPEIWKPLLHEYDLPVRSPDFSNANSITDFTTAVDTAVPDHPGIIIGWSLGGMLAAEFAHKYPSRVRALILIGTNPKFTNKDRTLGWPKRILQRMNKQLNEPENDVLQNFIKGMFSPPEVALRDQFMEFYQEKNWGTFHPRLFKQD